MRWSMVDSPTRVEPFTRRALSVALLNVTGSTVPCTFMIREASSMAVAVLPVISVRAVKNRLPKLCPLKLLPALKR